MRGTKLLRLLWALALGLLAACGGGGAPPPDLSLQSVSPQNPSVAQGQSLTLTLTFASQSGFQGQVGLQVTEGGQTPGWLSFSPQSASLNVPKGGQAQLALQVEVSPNAPVGSHPLKLRAQYGNKTAEMDLSLEVIQAFRLTLDWQPLLAATGADGTDGSITLTGTLEGNPPGTLELQLAYRPKGGEWGAWQTVASFQVQGNQVQATIPALDLPVGLDELGKQVRARVVAGDQTLAQSGDYTLFRYRPFWSQAWGRGFSAGELSANGNLVCGYGIQGFSARVVFCLNPETGATSWTYTFRVNTDEDYVYDIFVAEDGKVYVAQNNRILSLQNGTQLAQYDLSGDFAYVTALAVEGDTLYAAGSRWVNIGCGNILRARLAKYQVGSGLTRLALHDPTPQDLQEITTPGQCSSYRIYNYSSIPTLRLEGGKLYALFGIGDVRDNNTGQHISSHCMGFLRLDAATFARDWLTRPTRPGANRESTWQRDCPESSWYSSGTALILSQASQGPSPILWFKDRNFDLGDTQLYARYMGQDVLRKEDGAKETLPGEDPFLLFLPGGFVRFREVDAYLEARPAGTEGPCRLAGWESDLPGIYKDAQGRVYVYGHRNGELRVARIR